MFTSRIFVFLRCPKRNTTN